MKKMTPVEQAESFVDRMRSEYDFSGGVRGKYAEALRTNGYTLREYLPDGTFTERRVLGEKMVILEPDVWEYFPDSEAVNRALRTLISLVPPVPGASAKRERAVSGPPEA